MTMNPTDLSPRERRALSDLAAKSQEEASRAAVTAYLERSAKKSETNGAAESKQEHAFLEAAGGWDDMDVDAWLEEIYTQRQPPRYLAKNVIAYVGRAARLLI